MTSVETHLVRSFPGDGGFTPERSSEFGAGDQDLQPHVRLNISISMFTTV